MFDNIVGKSGFWSKAGPYSDVVLSTRIRLARNTSNLCFPYRLDKNSFSIINDIIRKFVKESSFSDCLNYIQLSEIDSSDKRFLRERNIITFEMEESSYSSVVIEKDERFVIMINEEDHFRIQIIKSGFRIPDAYEMADRVDEELNRYVPYAYSDNFGYITACPSNIGTGLKASTMLHLPALTWLKGIPDIINNIKEKGFSIHGTTGEENRTVGNMYIISNRKSLGLSEVDIIESLDELTNIVIAGESDARDRFMSDYGNSMEDKVWRSYGILKHSRCISFAEALEHLSNFRLGIVLSIEKNFELLKVNDLMVNIQHSHLQKIARSEFQDPHECDCFRAEYLRSQID